jgi:hypothetical protein
VCQVEWVFISSQTWHEAPPLQLRTAMYYLLSVSEHTAHTPLSCQPLAFNFMQWNLKKAKKLNSVSLFLLLCSLYKNMASYITTWTTKALSLSLSLVVWASMLSCPRSSVVTHMENTVSLVQVYIPPRAALFWEKVRYPFNLFNVIHPLVYTTFASTTHVIHNIIQESVTCSSYCTYVLDLEEVWRQHWYKTRSI